MRSRRYAVFLALTLCAALSLGPAPAQGDRPALDVLRAKLSRHPSPEVRAWLAERRAAATVETHRKNLKKKLGIATTAGLTRYVIEHGLT